MDILEIIDDREQSAGGQAARPFSCPWVGCQKSFNRKSDLQRHHRIHTNERPYECAQQGCGKSFIQRSALTVHIRTHTGEKPHHCEQPNCGKSFSDSSSLARHRRIHTGKRPYKCSVDRCDKSFCRKTTLTKHARRAHRISIDNQYSDDDTSDSDEGDSPGTEALGTPQSSWPRPSRAASQANGDVAYPIERSQSEMDFKAERMTPFSPQDSHPAVPRPSLANSFSFPPNTMAHVQDLNHCTVTHPLPLSQGAVYANQPCETVLSNAVSVPRPGAQDYGGPPLVHHYPPAGHRLEASTTPTPQHIITTGQTIQSSPSSLSSCSSQPESAHSQDLYYSQVQGLPIQQYQLQQSPMNHDGTLQFPQYQAVTVGQQVPHGQPMAVPIMPPQQQYHTIPQSQHQQQQQQAPNQVWYDTMAYHPPVMVSAPEPINQQRLYTPGNGVQDWWIKPEDNGIVLPSARLSNF